MATILKRYDGEYFEVLDECYDAYVNQVMVRYKALLGDDSQIYVFPKRLLSQERPYKGRYVMQFQTFETQLTIDEYRQELQAQAVEEPGTQHTPPHTQLTSPRSFYVTIFDPKYLLISALPLLLIIPIIIAYINDMRHMPVMSGLYYLYTIGGSITYFFSMIYFCSDYCSEIQLTQAEHTKFIRKNVTHLILVIVEFIALACGFIFAFVASSYSNIGTWPLYVTILPMIVFFITLTEFSFPKWLSDKEYEEEQNQLWEMSQPTTRGMSSPGGGSSWSPSPHTTPNSPRTTQSTSHTTHNTSHTNPNAPWEHFNREQDRYHNWACGHDDPYDCDHDDCY